MHRVPKEVYTSINKISCEVPGIFQRITVSLADHRLVARGLRHLVQRHCPENCPKVTRIQLPVMLAIKASCSALPSGKG